MAGFPVIFEEYSSSKCQFFLIKIVLNRIHLFRYYAKMFDYEIPLLIMKWEASFKVGEHWNFLDIWKYNRGKPNSFNVGHQNIKNECHNATRPQIRRFIMVFI